MARIYKGRTLITSGAVILGSNSMRIDNVFIGRNKSLVVNLYKSSYVNDNGVLITDCASSNVNGTLVCDNASYQNGTLIIM